MTKNIIKTMVAVLGVTAVFIASLSYADASKSKV